MAPAALSRFLVLIGALAIGCGAPPQCEFAAVPEPDARLALECGALIWKASINLTPDVAEVRVVREWEARDEGHPTAVGYWKDQIRQLTFVRDRLRGPDHWCLVAAHELGHALGLDHATAPALMNSSPSHACVGGNDAEECANHGLQCRVTCRRNDL